MTNRPENGGLRRITEAAEFLAISRSKVYMLMDSGQLSYVKIGKSRRIPMAALVRLIKDHTVTDVQTNDPSHPGIAP